MIRIKRPEIIAHLPDPCSSLFPAAGKTFRLIHQLISEDGEIVAIQDSGNRVATRGDLLDMLAIEPACRFVRVELHRAFEIYSEWRAVIVGAVDAGPTQIL